MTQMSLAFVRAIQRKYSYDGQYDKVIRTVYARQKSSRVWNYQRVSDEQKRELVLNGWRVRSSSLHVLPL